MNWFDSCPDRENSWSFKYSPSIMDMKLGTHDVVPLWVADMDFRCPPAVIEALELKVREGIFGYTTTADDGSLFPALSAWLKRRFQWTVPTEWILYSPGVVNSIQYLVASLCGPGERVILQNPVYPPFRSVIEDAGSQWVDNRLVERDTPEGTQYFMDLEDLEQKAADPLNKVLLLCSPCNPGGRVWTREELQAVKEITRKHGVFVISDEIHGDLIFPQYSHTPWGKQDDSQDWAVLVSPSKSFNVPGLNTSFAVIPHGATRAKFQKKKFYYHGAMENPLGLTAALAAYQHADSWLDQLREYLFGNYQVVKNLLPPDMTLFHQQGTYLAWINPAMDGDLGRIKDYFYRQHRLGVQMGRDFGPGGEAFIRLNFALPRKKLTQLLAPLTCQ